MSRTEFVRSWRVLGPTDPVEGLVIVFARTRTELLDAALVVDGERRPLDLHGSAARLDLPVGGRRATALEVKFRGEHPIPVEAHWISSARSAGVISPAGMDLRMTAQLAALSGEGEVHDETYDGWLGALGGVLDFGDDDRSEERQTFLRRQLRSMLQRWSAEARSELLEVDSIDRAGADALLAEDEALDVYAIRRQVNGDWSDIQEFFLTVDEESSPEEIELEQWRWDVYYVGALLENRIENRNMYGRWVHGNPPTAWVPFLDAPDASVIPRIERVSAWFRDLMVLHLDAHLGTEKVRWAFELFAATTLQARHPNDTIHAKLDAHAAPNGHFFLHFAELGLLCVDHGFDVEFWLTHLPALVEAAHVFVESCWELGSSGAPEAKTMAFRRERYFSRARLTEVRAQHVPADLPADPEQRRVVLEDRLTFLASRMAPLANFALNIDPSKDRPLVHDLKVTPAGVPDYDRIVELIDQLETP